MADNTLRFNIYTSEINEMIKSLMKEFLVFLDSLKILILINIDENMIYYIWYSVIVARKNKKVRWEDNV